MRFSFSLLIAAAALVGQAYLYWRVVRPLLVRTLWRRVAAAVLVGFTILLLLRGPIRDLGGAVARVHDLVAYSWLAMLICLVVAGVAADLVRIASGIAGLIRARVQPRRPGVRGGDEPADELAPAAAAGDRGAAPPVVEAPLPLDGFALGRRRVLQAFPWAVLAGGGGLVGFGAYRAFADAEVTETVVRLARLPRALDGLSIVQLTDVHVGSFIRRGFLERLVERANATRPDILVITGDLVDGSVPVLGDAVSALAALRARYGVFFVTGNHDYSSGDAAWVAFLERLGIPSLRNRRLAIGDGGGTFDLVGVDDWSGGRRRSRGGYDLEAAIAGRDPDKAAVLLAHQPANFEVAAERGMDLQISGHTHGGQLFPVSRLAHLRFPHHRGMYRHAGSHLYVSRGCGFWGPPSRLDSPPEIARIILTAG